MPLVPLSSYRPPFLLSNGHLQTVLPVLLRKADATCYRRERIATPDDDFLDIDWIIGGHDRVAVLSHGLEGSSHRPYVTGMARMLARAGWDVAAWNFRSCSGEPNRQFRLYHNGSTDDLDCVVRHVLATGRYGRLDLVGFSLGGNLTLLYLGRNAATVDGRIGRTVTFSVPCDLADGAHALRRPVNRLYMDNFLTSLHGKIRTKMRQFPGRIDDEGYGCITDFKGFDDRFTAPIHGFKDAEDYWERCSSSRVIADIATPVLIVNALDDPFLAGGCYPVSQAEASGCVWLEMPASGGHVGFVGFGGDGSYWSERRAVGFLSGS